MTLEKIIKYLKTGELSLYKMARKRKILLCGIYKKNTRKSLTQSFRGMYMQTVRISTKLAVYARSSDMNELGKTAMNIFRGEHHYDS